MLTQVQGFGGDEAAHPHGHPQDGGEREARLWCISSCREAGPFRIRHPCFLPTARCFLQALGTSSAECPVCAGGFVCRGSYRGLPGGRKNGDIVCRASVGKSDPVEDLFFCHEADGGSSQVHGLALGLRVEALLDDTGRFPANTAHAPLSPGIQFPGNSAI